MRLAMPCSRYEGSRSSSISPSLAFSRSVSSASPSVDRVARLASPAATKVSCHPVRVAAMAPSGAFCLSLFRDCAPATNIVDDEHQGSPTGSLPPTRPSSITAAPHRTGLPTSLLIMSIGLRDLAHRLESMGPGISRRSRSAPAGRYFLVVNAEPLQRDFQNGCEPFEGVDRRRVLFSLDLTDIVSV